MNCIVGIDIGTSAVKCVLITEDGQILGHSIKSNDYFYQGDWVEFSATERYDELCRSIRDVVDGKPSDGNIIAVCLSGASGNALLLDQEREPICNAVSWMDRRGETLRPSLLSSFSDNYIYAVVGWPKLTSFPLAYFAWMKEKETDLFYSATYHATDFVYYNYRLTNNWMIDTSTATNFYLQDQVNIKYHQPILDYLHIHEEELPAIIKSGERIGAITSKAAGETNLPKGTPVVAGAFDHPTAARGTGMTDSGDLLLSCGTSWVGFFPVVSREKIMKEELLIDPFLSQEEGPWGAMFSFSGMGRRINENVDLLFPDSMAKYFDFEASATSIDINGVECDFDLLQEERSVADYLQSMLGAYTIPVICASIIKSVSQLIQGKIVHFQNIGIQINRISMVGGFSATQVWPQAFANAFNRPITLNQGQLAGCFGAAILAGIGVGLFKDEADGFRKLNIESKIVTPNF